MNVVHNILNSDLSVGSTVPQAKRELAIAA